MIVVRYSAFFDEKVNNGSYYNELTLSLITLKNFVFKFTDVEIVFYTLSQYHKAIERLMSYFTFNFKIIVLDVDFSEKYAKNREFANSLSNLTDVDRSCVVRMLTDFDVLDKNTYRLLIGTDIFFLKCPQELLSFVWSGDAKRDSKVIYMMDVNTFAGQRYKLRYYNPPILNGLLGDFYCLAPGVSLSQDAIKGCLKMIDDWPVSPSRYDPAINETWTTPEQQAAAILLYPFGGEALSPDRYSHWIYKESLAAIHYHYYIQQILQDPNNPCAKEFAQILLDRKSKNQ